MAQVSTLRAGSSSAKVRTGPGGVSRVSNRTVTRPRPEPHTQPGPIVVVSRRRRPAASRAQPATRVARSSDRRRPAPRHRPPGRRRRRLVRLEQPFLDDVGQPGHADPEQPDAAGGVDPGQQRAGDVVDLIGPVGRVGDGPGPGVGAEVVQPDLQRDRPGEEPGGAAAGRSPALRPVRSVGAGRRSRRCRPRRCPRPRSTWPPVPAGPAGRRGRRRARAATRRAPGR